MSVSEKLRIERGVAVATYPALKRVIDLTLCLVALPALVLVAAACAIAILLDAPGPVLFTQERTGQYGRRFRMYKFRTMVKDAEELKASLAHRSIVPPPDFKVPDDPRVTRVGGFLRRSGLDELPQVINVILGQMSLVGPRPTSFDANTYEGWQLRRLEAIPGLTGLWQVEARNTVSFDERVRYDISYIETMSLVGDVRILLRTVGTVFRGEGV